MERGIEVFAVIQLMITGLSHIFHRQAWVAFFLWLKERGHPGSFVHGFLSLWFGALILAFHPVWIGIPAVLTVFGALCIIKAAICFLFPELQMRSLGRVSQARSAEMCVPGILFIVIASMLSYHLWIA